MVILSHADARLAYPGATGGTETINHATTSVSTTAITSNAHQSRSHMTETRVPESICPSCGAPNDGASHPDGKPSEGDLSICMYCGHLAIFRADLRLRDPTVAELEIIRHDERVQTMLRLRLKMFGDDGYPRRRR